MNWLAPVVGAVLFVVVSCAASAETSGGSAESISAQVTSNARPDFVGSTWRLAHVATGDLSFDVHPLNCDLSTAPETCRAPATRSDRANPRVNLLSGPLAR